MPPLHLKSEVGRFLVIKVVGKVVQPRRAADAAAAATATTAAAGPRGLRVAQSGVHRPESLLAAALRGSGAS